MRSVLLALLFAVSGGLFLTECEGAFPTNIPGDMAGPEGRTSVTTAGSFPILGTDADGTLTSDYAPDTVYQWRLPDGGFVIGYPDAPVTIISFSDFLCPACQNYADTTLRDVFERLVLTGQAKFAFRMVVTQQSSQLVFSAFECAAEISPGGFYPAYSFLFDLALPRDTGDEIVTRVANANDLNEDGLRSCTETADQYEIDGRLAQEARVFGVPSIRVQYGDGPLETINGREAGGLSFEEIAAAVAVGQ